ncbi:TerB family tellurite resistance protein [Pelagibacterium sp. H642]|uniref:tellurite resistance TerB family protein n=1 Tax=Pelagibacterium sp. H642 TaxID=1881069 RepID=UPI0028151952|nr:TerB family tellurite resistance protein [Pelagibacterium sp. H642]WMT92346.1 TerB family tellurite resistance protein [Pelagibacterium sp. H642]
MFDAIARLFGQPEINAAQPMEPRMAVAALLVHLASVDGASSPIEAKAIANALKDHYDLEEGEVKKLLAEARRRDRDAVDFYQFTTRLARLEEAEKIEIIRMMWQVVFADDSNHELEDNMVWRVAELIGVSSRQRTILRNQAKRSTTPPDTVPQDSEEG